MVKIAILSDVHLEHETIRWARCRSCGALLVSRHSGDGDQCACGEADIIPEDGRRRFRGCTVEPPESPGWGDFCREHGADIVLLAGDIHSGIQALPWAAKEFPGLPMCYTMGNHETYGYEITGVIDTLRRISLGFPGIWFLEKDVAEFDIRGEQVLILGTTLWTNYALLVGADDGAMRRRSAIENAMWHAERGINDHSMIGIRHAEGGAIDLFSPKDALRFHQESVAWLDSVLEAAPSHATVIVMTHHAPHPDSEAPEHRSGRLSPSFVSDLTALIEARQPALWVHGHTHWSCDHTVGRTRIVSHQHGYPHEPTAAGFMPKIIEIGGSR